MRALMRRFARGAVAAYIAGGQAETGMGINNPLPEKVKTQVCL